MVEALSPSLVPGPRWAILRAHARALGNRFFVARSPQGTAVAMEERHPRGRLAWVIHVPGEHDPARATGIDTAEGEDRAQVACALIGELRAHARALGVAHLVVARCPEADRAIAAAAARLGAREVPAPPDHVIEAAGFDEHLRALGSKRAWKLRQDLSRAEKAGARLATLSPPPAGDEAFQLLRQTLARKQSRFLFGSENLLTQLAAEAPSAITLCHGAALLGFLFAVRCGEMTQFAYLGRAADPPLHVSAALWSWSVKHELERGARRLVLGMTGEVLKQRLGARPVPQVHYYLGA